MSKKSQVDKFNQRLAKAEQDTWAIKSAEAKKRASDPFPDPSGTEELKEIGNIKEAAMVVTMEGINTFATMFANTAERLVNEIIERKVSALIDDKMIQMLEGVSLGLSRGMNQLMDATILNKINEILPEPEETPQIQEPVKPASRLQDWYEEKQTRVGKANLTVVPSPEQMSMAVEPEKPTLEEHINSYFEEELQARQAEVKEDEYELTQHAKDKREIVFPDFSLPPEPQVQETPVVTYRKPDRWADYQVPTEHLGKDEPYKLKSTKIELAKYAPMYALYLHTYYSGEEVKLSDISKNIAEQLNVRLLSTSATYMIDYLVANDPDFERVRKGVVRYRA